MLYKTVHIQIPEAMEPYINNENEKRNALLLYPYILDRKISPLLKIKLVFRMKRQKHIYLNMINNFYNFARFNNN